MSTKEEQDLGEESAGEEEGVEGNNQKEINVDEGSKKKRKHQIRKKKRKPNTTGFEPGKVESLPHAADVNRYDKSLPFDQRLLRAVDEYRNLRGLGARDYKLAYTSLLVHFKIDVRKLRLKYGKQSLRGFSYEEKSNEGGGGDNNSVATYNSDQEDEEEVEINSDQTEDGWSKEILSSESIAQWLQDRFNDRFTPFLTLAPLIMSNFLTFLLTRNVLPDQTSRIESILPIANLAKVQFSNSAALFNLLLNDPFHKSLTTLFPNQNSTLDSPIDLEKLALYKKEKEDAEKKRKKEQNLPKFISGASFLEELGDSTTEEELEKNTTELLLTTIDPNDSKTSTTDDSWPNTPRIERDPLKIAAKIQKSLEDDVRLLEAWNIPKQDLIEAGQIVKKEFERLGLEGEGIWKVGFEERSARSILNWEKIDGLKVLKAVEVKQAVEEKVKEEKQGEEEVTKQEILPPPDLYRLILSGHHEDFPLTSTITPPPTSTLESLAGGPSISPHSLQEEITLIVPSTYHKFFVNNLVIEADYRQIILTPNPNSTSKSSNVGGKRKELWILNKIYRFLPSYYKYLGENVREEPDRILDFAGNWDPKALEEKFETAENGNGEGHAGGEGENGENGENGTAEVVGGWETEDSGKIEELKDDDAVVKNGDKKEEEVNGDKVE